MASTQVATKLNKPTIGRHLNLHFPDTLDFLSEFDMKRYRLQRRLIGPLYQTANLKKFEAAVDGVIRQVVARLDTLDGAEVDLKEWMHIVAVECLGAVVLSWSPGYIRAGSDGGTSAQGYLGWKRKSVFGLFPLATKIAFFSKSAGRLFANLWGVTFKTPPNFKPFFTVSPLLWTFYAGCLRLTQKRCCKAVYQKSSKRIAVSLRESRPGSKGPPPDTRRDLLADLIRLHKDRPEFTELYLRRLAMTNFGAGHETLCSALTAIMAMIGSHPDVRQKVAQEVRSPPPPGVHDEAVRLRYTQACIKEAQRLHPVIGMSLPRRVPRDGMRLHGFSIPPGTTVGCSPVSLHRNPDIFGSGTNDFAPERWLRAEGEEAEMRTMERYNLT